MRKISNWARQHRWKTRFLIVLIYLVLNLTGLFLGDVLFQSGLILPASVIYATCFIFLLAVIFYPSRKIKIWYKNFYQLQKTADLVLGTASFILIICFSNHYNTSQSLFQSPFQPIYAISNNTVGPDLNESPIIEKKSVIKKKGIKNLKQKLRENIRLLKKEYKEATQGEKTVLIIVSVLIALGLLLLLAGLSCNISCSGSEGAAVVVAILGTALIIFLLVKVIKGINRGKPKKEQPPSGALNG